MKTRVFVLLCITWQIGVQGFAQNGTTRDEDYVIVGAGIMGATLAAMLGELDSSISVGVYEKLDRVAGESSGDLANAGTGHAALAELNYTPQLSDGTIDISKALDVANGFEVSKQFWGYLVKSGALANPETFIRSVPHIAWVKGSEDREFLRKRYELLIRSPLFAGMEYSTSHRRLQDWMPLVDTRGINAATRSELGTDVNFRRLTEMLLDHAQQKGTSLYLQHEITDLQQTEDGRWRIEMLDRSTKSQVTVRAKNVFLAAGGATILLLQKSGIAEGNGIGGFPISGQFLVCKNEELAREFHAKVYGKAKVGAPPMSVPHLDTRIIDGKKLLVFGPFAGFRPHFTKQGSILDLFTSMNLSNLFPMLSVGVSNVPLISYLVDQITLTHEQRMEALREFYPDAQSDEWELLTAGQRVQIIKKDAKGNGKLEFGTELVTSGDRTISALLGASPGASISVAIILQLLQRTFPREVLGPWRERILQMIPSYGQRLDDNKSLVQQVRSTSHRDLKLKGISADCESSVTE